MATNTNVNQGTLNRARVSLSFSDYSDYNISAASLAQAGVSVAPSGPTSTLIGTMTGAVASHNTYQMVDITVHLIRTMALSKKFESKRQTNCTFGTLTVRGDSTAMQPWTYYQATLVNIDTMNFNGTELDYVLHFQARYPINSDLFA